MTKIFYFSGTGNTLWSAKKIAELIGGNCELINIGLEAQKDALEINADAVVLLFPSYAFGLPVVVRRFLKKAAFTAPYIASFVTYGSFPGGTLAEASRILNRKKTGFDTYYGRIPAVENYIAIFGPPKEKTLRCRLAMQRDASAEAARSVIKRQVNRINTFRPLSIVVSLLFTLGTKLFYRFYRVSDACNGCGICEKACPVSAVRMANGRPVFLRGCEHCQGCLNWCPQKAISFARVRPGTARYCHPEITVGGYLDSGKQPGENQGPQTSRIRTGQNPP